MTKAKQKQSKNDAGQKPPGDLAISDPGASSGGTSP